MENEKEGKKRSQNKSAADSGNSVTAQSASISAPIYNLNSLEKEEEKTSTAETQSLKLNSTAGDEESEKNILGKVFTVNKKASNELEKYGAKAFVQGNKMFIPSDFDPLNEPDQKLFLHELHHIIENNFSSAGKEENEKSENEADAFSVKNPVKLSGEVIQRIITAKQANNNIGSGPIQRKGPDSMTPSAQEIQILKNYDNNTLNPTKVNSIREQLQKDVNAKILENTEMSKDAVKEAIAELPSTMNSIKIDADIAEQHIDAQEELKTHIVGKTYNGPRSIVPQKFILNHPPEFSMQATDNSSKDSYEQHFQEHQRHQGILDNLANTNPILYGAIKTGLGDIHKLNSMDKKVAEHEGRHILNQIADACNKTGQKAAKNELDYRKFKTVIEQLKKEKYVDNKAEIDYVLAQDAEIQKFWDYGKFGLELILAVGSAFATGGWSIAFTAAGFGTATYDANEARKEYNIKKTVFEGSSHEANANVNQEEVSQANANMVVSIGGAIIGCKDGLEVFRYLKNATNLQLIKAASNVTVNSLSSADEFTRFIKHSGGWQNAAKMIEGNEDLAKRMVAFRDSEFKEIKKVIEDAGAKVSRTGSVLDATSDLDASVLGTMSVEARQQVYQMMKNKYGFNSNQECVDFLDMGLFGDSKLKYGYQSLSPKYQDIVASNIAVTENSAILNRLIKEAEIANNGAKATYYRELLEKGGMKSYNFKPLSEREIHQVNKEIDNLYRKSIAAEDSLEEAQIMQNLQEKLTLVDISDPAAYHSGAGVYKMNAFREMNEKADHIWTKLRDKGPHKLSTGEKDQLLMGHFSAYSDALLKFDKDPLATSTIRKLGKYGMRTSEAIEILGGKRGIKRLKKRFKYIFEVGDLVNKGNSLEEALEIISIPSVGSIEEFEIYMKHAMVKADAHISPQIPRILAGNKKTISKGAQKGLKPTEAFSGAQNLKTFLFYEDARKVIGIAGSKAATKATESEAKAEIAGPIENSKTKPKKKKTNYSKQKQEPESPNIQKNSAELTESETSAKAESKSKKIRTNSKYLKELSRINAIARTDSSAAYNLMHGLATKQGVDGKSAKPIANIHKSFEKQMVLIKKSIKPAIIKEMSRKINYLEKLLLTGFDKAIERNEVRKVFKTIRANIWTIVEKNAANMVPSSIKDQANTINKAGENVKSGISSTVGHSLKPLKSLLRIGKDVVDSTTPDFMKNNSKD